ncbi:MAG: aminodeoxychorismate synthase component I [Litorimonas sp.]
MNALSSPSADYYVLLDDQSTGQQLYFSAPQSIITAQSIADVAPAFNAIETALSNGKYIAGYFAYELGVALDPSLQHLLKPEEKNARQPLLKLGVFSAPNNVPPAKHLYTRKEIDIDLTPSWSEADYVNRFNRIKDYINAGDCYQVNLTFPLYGETQSNAEDIFAVFRQNQPGRYGALVKLGGADIISFSPELFFERVGQNMRMRPMKGTRPRSQTGNITDDVAIAQAMREEPKSQAENLMIVDLLRNDLSRLATQGSVKVPELFTLETYPTLHQMTSQVRAQLKDNLSWLDVFKGLYPCGSITGAPKIRAMEIIHELESGPRGPYCGAIGFIAPDNSACFNVAIRTAVLDQGELRYDVGSGVVYDSGGADEYRECLLKSHILRQVPEYVFETFRKDPMGNFIRIDAHLSRLKSACEIKGWNYPERDIQTELQKAAKANLGHDMRVKLQVNLNHAGQVCTTMTQSNFTPNTSPLSLAISRYTLSPNIQTADIKTSRRTFYDGERKRIQTLAAHEKLAAIDEVIFFNSSDCLCEGSYTSIYVEIDGELFTPPLSTNILPSILRNELIQTQQVQVRSLTIEDLRSANAVFCGNSLRGLLPAQLVLNKAL